MDTRYAIVELEAVGSTQDEARSRFTPNRPVLVTATRQAAGRGRLGREWVEPSRAMFASLAVEPSWPREVWGLIPLTAGLAVRAAIGEQTGVAVDLRWPNDLLIRGAKTGGLLAEASGGVVVIGCGVNVAWDSPIEGAASLYDADPGPEIAADLARAWAGRVSDALEGDADRWGRDEYRDACVTIGRDVSYPSGSGVAIDVSEDGSLLVETSRGVVSVRSGEVRLRGRATLPPERRG